MHGINITPVPAPVKAQPPAFAKIGKRNRRKSLNIFFEYTVTEGSTPVYIINTYSRVKTKNQFLNVWVDN